MAADRKRRNVAAEILAAYLRGTLDRAAARDQIYALAAAQKSRHQDHAVVESAWYLNDMYLPVTEQRQQHFRRLIAFLKTDLAWDPPHELAIPPSSDPWLQRQAIIHVAALLAAVAAGYWLSWWIVVAAIPLSAILFYRVAQEHETIYEQRLRVWEAYKPFAGEAQWLEHQHLADEHDLPAYEDSPFSERTSGAKPAGWLKQGTLCIAKGIGYSLAGLGYILAWPLLLTVTAITSTRQGK